MVRIEIRTVMFNNIRENSRVIYKSVPVLIGKHAFLQRDLRELFLGEGSFILKGIADAGNHFWCKSCVLHGMCRKSVKNF